MIFLLISKILAKNQSAEGKTKKIIYVARLNYVYTKTLQIAAMIMDFFLKIKNDNNNLNIFKKFFFLFQENSMKLIVKK